MIIIGTHALGSDNKEQKGTTSQSKMAADAPHMLE